MPSRQVRRPNGSESKTFPVRVPVDLLEAAKARAAERNETLSFAIIEFLRRYSK